MTLLLTNLFEIGTWSEHPNYSFIQTERTIFVSK